MVLADLGAEVVRIDVPARMFATGRADLLNRGRPSVALDSSSRRPWRRCSTWWGRPTCWWRGCAGCDRAAGAGPEECHARNPRLVYARMTGWGQDGPWSGPPATT